MVEIKITYAYPFLRLSQKSEKNLKVYMVFGDALSTLQFTDVCMDFEPCLKV